MENKVYIINTDLLLDPEIYSFWYDKMPDYRKKKIDAYIPDTSKRLSLGAGIALNKALEDIGITQYEVILNEHEKPYLKEYEDIFFNLSHSGNVAICAISDRELGADVQQLKTFSDSLIKRAFDEREISYIESTYKEASEKSRAYTKLWTIKESVMKYYSSGLSMDPIKIHVDFGEKTGVLCSETDCGQLKFFYRSIGDVQLTICSKYNNFFKVIKYIKKI